MSSENDTRPRLLLLTPDYPPAPGGIQVVAERLAEGLERFQTRTVALAAAGAEEYDAAHTAQVRRVGADAVPHMLAPVSESELVSDARTIGPSWWSYHPSESS